MKFKKKSMDGLFSIYEIAKILKVSQLEVFKMRQALSIKPTFKKGNSQFYRVDQFKFTDVYRFYPMKTTETYYIYESKMNLL